LLLNVALHGPEGAAGVRSIASGRHAGETAAGSPVAIRYADDVTVLCHSQEQAGHVKARPAEWPAPRGLAFNEDKTRIARLEDGFDFPGSNVRRHNRKLLIKPSSAAVKRLRERLAAETRTLRGASAAAVIMKPSPVIRGGAAYYRTVVSSEIFSSPDSYLWKLLWKRARWRHQNKPGRWAAARYFGKFNRSRDDHRVSGDRDSGGHLVKFSRTAIERHTPAKGTAPPDDPALAGYRARRRTRIKPPPDKRTPRPLTRQAGMCPLCGDHLLSAGQPPQSPAQREQRWLRVTRKAIAASYLAHHNMPSPPDGERTSLVHASCHRRKPEPQLPPETPPRLA
jgi:RNA-directed DNA polymerase